MKPIYDQIEEFVGSKVIYEIEEWLKHLSSDNRFQFTLLPEEPKMIARVAEITDKSEISISLGYFIRTALIIHFFESAKFAQDSGIGALVAAHVGNVYDHFAFYARADIEFSFVHIPVLKPIFLENIDRGEHWGALKGFEECFNNSINEHEDLNYNFRLLQEFSCESKEKLLLAFKFLVAHEAMHVLRSHTSFLEGSTVASFSEDPLENFALMSNRKKACEIDADCHAFLSVVSEKVLSSYDRGILDIVQECVEPCLLMISLFDVHRQSIREYQGVSASHPIPDVRARAIMAFSCDKLKISSEKIYSQVWGIFKKAIEKVSLDFRNTGIAKGGFFLIANHLYTIDDQLSPKIFFLAMIHDEFSRIAPHFSEIEFGNEKTVTGVDWVGWPIQYSALEFAAACQAHAIEAFSGKYRNFEGKEDVDDYFSELLQRFVLSLDVELDRLVLIHSDNQKIESEFWEDVWDRDTGEVSKKEIKKTNKQYMERIFGLKMSIWLTWAKAEISDIEN